MIKEVADYYNAAPEQEWERLNTPYANIEFTTTLFLIDKYFNKSGKILDVGSGPGRYALALAKKGYEVALVDISEKELELAKKHFKDQGLTAQGFHCLCGGDLSLFEDQSFDGVLIMGPMYHIHHQEERMKVLNHCHRILKPGGTALIAYINVFGVMKSSLYECPDAFKDYKSVLNQLLKGKVAYSHEEAFTAAYFTTPEDALSEIKQVPFEILTSAGAESLMSGMHLEVKRLYEENKELYDNYLKIACETCELETFRNATEHFNVIVRKNT